MFLTQFPDKIRALPVIQTTLNHKGLFVSKLNPNWK